MKIAYWPAPLRLPTRRTQVAGLVACTCFRCLILVRSAVGVGRSRLQMWCPREDLANSKDSRVRAGYVREERQGVRGRFMFAVGPRTGECCLKTRTLEEGGSGWNPASPFISWVSQSDESLSTSVSSLQGGYKK